MKKLTIILLSMIVFAGPLSSQTTKQNQKELYPIVKNGLWGYIDQKGKIAIKPRFRIVDQFSEGLAPARLNGTYGYINQIGEFVIPPAYDLAYPFQKGEAIVFMMGKPYYIDKQGKIRFEHGFAEITGFNEDQISIVATQSKKYGVINHQGELIADTIFQHIAPFKHGRAVVTGLNHDSYPESGEPVYEIGVINTKGEWIVSFGKYKGITNFINSFARVELPIKWKKGYYDYQGIIDTTGKFRFTIPAKKWEIDRGYETKGFSEDLAVVSIYSVDRDTVKIWSSSHRYTYKGVVNPDGEIVFSNKDWDEITPFKHNRAFVKNQQDEWYLIDQTGKVLNEEPYINILHDTYEGDPKYLFQDGTHFVEIEEGWRAIDTTGRFIGPIGAVDPDYLHRRGSIIFLQEDISIESPKYSFQYGFWDAKNDVLVEPRFHDISFAEFTHELIQVMENGLMSYIDRRGNYVWRQKRIGNQVYGKMNIDYMNRGYFYASAPYVKKLANLDGWGGSRNGSKKLEKNNPFAKGKLSLQVAPDERARYRQKYTGMKLYVVNQAMDTALFPAQDSRLYLKIQAKDQNGVWKDIEYLPSSWCGNSYHTLFLPSDHYWEFTIPVYEGSFKTQLRAELVYQNSENSESIIYSNTFEGSVNPGQFWRKQAYYSSGLMDPYVD